MPNKEVLVFISLNGTDHFVGHLWCTNRKGRESASFEYDPSWLSHPERFALEPALLLTEGTFHTTADQQLFGSIGDSAPDRWGRVLMRRAEVDHAKEEKRTQRTLGEVDYLLGVNDVARQGALRFSETKEGPFLEAKEEPSIPPLIELPRLLSAAEHYEEDTESAEELRLLLAPGSSLGGARPKASVIDKDGSLAIAKFPQKNDAANVVVWEAITLTLAKKAGLDVSDWHLEKILGKDVLVLRRFDRQGNTRIPFLSAMSMLGAKDLDQHSYLEILDALRQYGAELNADSAQLWRRIVFSILVSNTDDHLRNHGFLYERQKGWKLSPAYDINPTPTDIKSRVLTTAIDQEDATASLDLALSVIPNFGLSQEKAKSIIREVGQAVATWRDTAKKFKLSVREIDRMSSAFEHEDLEKAKRM